MSVVGDGIELLKLVDKGHNAPLYSQLGEWIEKVASLHKQNEDLIDQVAKLRDQLRFKGDLERIAGHVFVFGDDEEVCPRCAEVEMKPVHLIAVDHARPPYQRAGCPSCKTVTQDPRPRRRQEFNAKRV